MNINLRDGAFGALRGCFLGILDDAAQLVPLRQQLVELGIAAQDVLPIDDPEALAIEAGERAPRRALTFDALELEQRFHKALLQGEAVVAVRAAAEEDAGMRMRVAKAFYRCGGVLLAYFGQFTFEQLPNPQRAAARR